MAETSSINKLSLPLEQQDSDQLIKYLEEKYNMPNVKWWEEVHNTFQSLRNILERGQDYISNEEDDPESISAQAARADALPLVTLLPSGSHALHLTATNEDLQCVAFGTISAERYVDIFWEAVARIEDEGGNFMVYRIDSDRNIFWFNYEGYNCQLLYLHCEQLVRSCPGIIKVPDRDLQDADTRTRKVVEGIKRDTNKRQAYFSESYQKASYYYLRAWTIAQGRYTSNERLTSARTLQFQELIKIMYTPTSKHQEKPALAMSYHISDIFQNLDEKVLSRPPWPQPVRKIDPDGGPAELLTVLQEAEAESLDSKLQMWVYIQVSVPSSLVCLLY
jgi:hypothetical protein